MNESIIDSVVKAMSGALNCGQLRLLRSVLASHLTQPVATGPTNDENSLLLASFLDARRSEGCSPRTLSYYESTVDAALSALGKPISQLTTDDLRSYLLGYEEERGVSKVTVDNIRRVLNSFFSWLEDEDYIVKSPMRKIRHVKAPTKIKDVISDRDLESLRDGCGNARDLAIVDLLASTGMRVGELVRLDRSDVNFTERECIVFGKGGKERRAYFDARTELHLQAYLKSRTDDNAALFVTLKGSAKRLQIGGVERMVSGLGRSQGIGRVHPHKFRRTMATNAIDKGMPVEQVQALLGHAKIETTMRYALVSQRNVKESHRKYLG